MRAWPIVFDSWEHTPGFPGHRSSGPAYGAGRGGGGRYESVARDRVFVADLAGLAVDVEFAAFAADDLSCSLDCLVLGAQHVVGLLMAWLGDLPSAA